MNISHVLSASACGPSQWPLFAGFGPLGALPTAPSVARAFAAQTLRDWGLPSSGAESCELVVSELATNVVRAARGPDGHPRYGADGRLPELFVRLLSDRRRLRAEVWDTIPAAVGTPVPRHADLTDESGRGLVIVEAVTDRWGWDEIPGWPGKRVWAVFGDTGRDGVAPDGPATAPGAATCPGAAVVSATA